VEKNRHGIALSDDDRQPWLERLRASITDWIAAGHNVVLACSALKSSYRQELEVGPEVRFALPEGKCRPDRRAAACATRTLCRGADSGQPVS
jgi:gluconate kinase